MCGQMVYGCLYAYGWTGGQHVPTASVYLMLLSPGVTDLFIEFFKELLYLLTGFLQENLSAPLTVFCSQVSIHIQFFQLNQDQAVEETEAPPKNGEPHPGSICHPHLQEPPALKSPSSPESPREELTVAKPALFRSRQNPKNN